MMENLLKFLCLVCAIFYFWLLFSETALTSEHATFCKSYMVWVNKYPTALSAGCCDYNHKSNDNLKEEYLGDPMLICYG